MLLSEPCQQVSVFSFFLGAAGPACLKLPLWIRPFLVPIPPPSPTKPCFCCVPILTGKSHLTLYQGCLLCPRGILGLPHGQMIWASALSKSSKSFFWALEVRAFSARLSVAQTFAAKSGQSGRAGKILSCPHSSFYSLSRSGSAQSYSFK